MGDFGDGLGGEEDVVVFEEVSEVGTGAWVGVLDGFIFFIEVEFVPEFFGDEGDEGVEEEEELAEDEVLDGEAVIFGGEVLIFCFGDFEVPVAEVGPEEGVEVLDGEVEFVDLEVVLDIVEELGEGGEDGVVIGVEGVEI